MARRGFRPIAVARAEIVDAAGELVARVADRGDRRTQERWSFRRGRERAVDARERGLVGGVAADRPEHVDAADVLAAFPDRMALRVAQLPREAPVFAVAVA